VRRDPLADQPAEEGAGAIGGVGGEPLGLMPTRRLVRISMVRVERTSS
jgi:hypothetical protein